MLKHTLDVELKHLTIIKSILSQHLSGKAKVWVFGSRAKANAKLFSDLDLVIDADQPLSIPMLASLDFDFEESDLPYKVDLVDWQTISPSFRALIEKDRIQIEF